MYSLLLMSRMPTDSLISLFSQTSPSLSIFASFLSYKVGMKEAEKVLRTEEELSMEAVPPTRVPFRVSSTVFPSSFSTSIFRRKCCGFCSINFKSLAVIICSTTFPRCLTGWCSINPSRSHSPQFLPIQKRCSCSYMRCLRCLWGRPSQS